MYIVVALILLHTLTSIAQWDSMWIQSSVGAVCFSGRAVAVAHARLNLSRGMHVGMRWRLERSRDRLSYCKYERASNTVPTKDCMAVAPKIRSLPKQVRRSKYLAKEGAR